MTSPLIGRRFIHKALGQVIVVHENPRPEHNKAPITVSTMCPAEPKLVEVYRDDLRIPEMTRDPHDVAVGEAWRVNVDNGFSRADNVVAEKVSVNGWVTCTVDSENVWLNSNVELVCPLSERLNPSEYEVMTVFSESDYDSLPVGSVVDQPFALPLVRVNRQWRTESGEYTTGSDLSGVSRAVLRLGWGGVM